MGEFFHAEMDTTVMGYIRCAREVVAGMCVQGRGRTVNVCGLSARQTGNAVGNCISPKSRAINGDTIAVGGGTPRSIHC